MNDHKIINIKADGTKPPIRIVRWLNVYKDGDIRIHTSQETAQAQLSTSLGVTICLEVLL